jgi:hypothetical protein
MTHAELVERAVRWLRGTAGCPIAFGELVTVACSEQPDAMGFRDCGASTYVIECKASRADFLADRHKGHRRAEEALGLYRYYMCPPGLIKPEEVPERWGLLYAHPAKVELVKGKRPKCWKHEPEFHCQPHRPNEMGVLFSLLCRLRLHLGPAEFDRIAGMTYSDRRVILDQRESSPSQRDSGR